eukprot:725748-Pleurochrysis_carterae.AAC.2
MHTIPFIGDLDLSCLQYSDRLIINRNGGKTLPLSYKDEKHPNIDRLRFQTSADTRSPLLKLSFNVSLPLAQQVDQSRKTLDISIDKAQHAQLHHMLECIDARNIDECTTHSQEWFKKTMDRETVKEMYVPLLRKSVNDGYNDIARFKIRVGENPTDIQVVLSEDDETIVRAPGDINDVVKGCRILAIVEINSMWFMTRQFGMSMVISKLLVWPVHDSKFSMEFNIGKDKKFRMEKRRREVEEDEESHFESHSL